MGVQDKEQEILRQSETPEPEKELFLGETFGPSIEEFDQIEALKPPAFSEINEANLNSMNEDNHEASPINVKLDNPFSLDDEQNETNGLKPEEEFIPLTKTQEELTEVKEL